MILAKQIHSDAAMPKPAARKTFEKIAGSRVLAWAGKKIDSYMALTRATSKLSSERLKAVKELENKGSRKAKWQLLYMLMDGEDKVRNAAIEAVKTLKLDNNDLEHISRWFMEPGSIGTKHQIRMLDSLARIKNPKTANVLMGIAQRCADGLNYELTASVTEAFGEVGVDSLSEKERLLLLQAYRKYGMATHEGRLAFIIFGTKTVGLISKNDPVVVKDQLKLALADEKHIGTAFYFSIPPKK